MSNASSDSVVVINPERFGTTFSLKQCRNFDLDGPATLEWLIDQAGFRRFRLMSYWNEHEKSPGEFDFAPLDWQLKRVANAGGQVSLCLGARQPRWPENHWPEWAWQLDVVDRSKALLCYLQTVVERYRDWPVVISYQLENEALLTNWGERSEVLRPRLLREYALVRRLDPCRPLVMTTSTSWGVPVRTPIPDVVGFSFYHTLYRDGGYHHSLLYPWVHRLRKNLIWLIHRKPVFIHELQLEPWGPAAIWEMSELEQVKSMNPAQIAKNIALSQAIDAYPIDLWGAEWWYWRLLQGDATIWEAVKRSILERA